MAQEYRVGIIGGGPAGCFCAYNLQQECDVTIFEMSSPLKTLLVTGGGRCNLAHAEYDFRELTKFYPRGEKFLYSVFSKFGTADTLEFFHSIGVETYTQDDNRIFPTSNSAADVKEKFLNALRVCIKKEKALRINQLDDMLEIVTDAGSYKFDAIVVAIGGHAGYNIAKYLGHNIIDPKPALVGLKTDKIFPSGVVLKNVKTKIGKKFLQDDLLFTHNGISGPLAFKISSLNARENFPYTVTLDVTGEIDLQKMFDSNPHKTLKNLIGELVPKSFAAAICPPEEIKSSSPSPAWLALASQPATALSSTPLKNLAHVPSREIFSDIKCSQVSAKIREIVNKNLRSLELKVLSHSGTGEVVTCGGVDLKEINPKTMESKLVPRLYFCGEVLDIDGFCGGFNLQNCWSTAHIAAQAILAGRNHTS